MTDANLYQTGAAVCILYAHNTNTTNDVRGLARMVQVSTNLTIVDLALRGVSPGKYWATVRETGDISDGANSTGGIWETVKAKISGSTPAPEPRGVFGTVEVDKDGSGTVFLDRPVSVWELVGRSMVVSKQKDGLFPKDDSDTLAGVIARSAGVWDNEKTVCSCSGNNLWEERKEQIGKGML